MKRFFPPVAACALLAWASLAGAATVTRIAASGHAVQLGFYYKINRDCTSAAKVTIRTTGAPANGVVTVVSGREFARTVPPTSEYSGCNTRRVPGVLVTYRSRANFAGQDRTTIDAIYDDGHENETTFQIDVK